MAMWLRQSTASQEIQLGMFVDDTDFKTAETGLTIANTDIKLFKHGATSQASKNSGGATHIANGWYYAVLDATDTNTLGLLEVTVNVSGALSVRREFMILPAMIYDSLVLGTDRLDTNTTHINDVAASSVTTIAAVLGTTSAPTITSGRRREVLSLDGMVWINCGLQPARSGRHCRQPSCLRWPGHGGRGRASGRSRACRGL